MAGRGGGNFPGNLFLYELFPQAPARRVYQHFVQRAGEFCVWPERRKPQARQPRARHVILLFLRSANNSVCTPPSRNLMKVIYFQRSHSSQDALFATADTTRTPPVLMLLSNREGPNRLPLDVRCIAPLVPNNAGDLCSARTRLRLVGGDTELPLYVFMPALLFAQSFQNFSPL